MNINKLKAMLKVIFISITIVLLSKHTFSQINFNKDSLDGKLKLWLPDVKDNTPGYVIGILHKDSIVYKSAMGSANIELRVPLSHESVFNIGSVTKQFTGFAIMQLEDAGKLMLTDKVAKYLPEYEVFQKHNITINHLLHHTSGLREMFELLEVSDNQVYGITMDHVKNILLRQKKLNFNPGESFQYINTNYFFLALIIEKLEGMSYPAYLQKNIFNPLNMKTATVIDEDQKLVPNRTSAYVKSNASTFVRANPTDNFYGPGSIYCTLTDLLKWGSNIIYNKIGSPAIYGKFLQRGSYRNGIALKYAGGVYVDSYKGINIIEHEGSRVGYTSQIVSIPDKETVIVILANSRSFPVRDIYRKIMDYVFKGAFTEPVVAESPKQIKPSIIQLPAKNLYKYSGTYWNQASDLRRRIYVRDDTLRYQRTLSNESIMLPVDATTFILKTGSTITNHRVVFTKSPSNKWNITFIPESGDTSYFAQVDTFRSNNHNYKVFQGLYYCDEIDAKFEIRNTNNKLVLMIKGWEPIVLESGFSNYFFNVDFGGSIYFNTNKKGKNSSFTYTSPKTKNLIFQRMFLEN